MAENLQRQTSKNVLIIDDSVTLRRILIKYLSQHFTINFLEANNGKEGLESLLEMEANVDLIFVDLRMPIMGGFEFLKFKNSIKSIKDIPSICLTAQSGKDIILKCLDYGAQDIILKPFDIKVIIEKVSKYFDR